MYYKTFQQTLQLFRESEPDMNEEMREKMATKLAEAVCKTFPKEKLNYSDTDINEFIKEIM